LSKLILFFVAYLFDSFYVRVSTITAIWTAGHRFKTKPTNWPRFTAPSLPWWSPIQVLTEVFVAYNGHSVFNLFLIIIFLNCVSVAGNACNAHDRCVAAGYDNGDIKLFDLRNMSLRWETNVKNGVGVWFMLLVIYCNVSYYALYLVRHH